MPEPPPPTESYGSGKPDPYRGANPAGGGRPHLCIRPSLPDVVSKTLPGLASVQAMHHAKRSQQDPFPGLFAGVKGASKVVQTDDNSGRTAAAPNSLVATCKGLGADPFAYLRDVFNRISAHPNDRLDELLPDKWAAARADVTS